MAALNGKPTFGAGRAFMIPNVTNPMPTRALVPQNQTIDIKRKVESLFGEKIFAAAVGVGETEVTGKVEFGKSVASVWASLLSGDSTVTGSYLEADKESGTIPGSSTYVITTANATNFLFDLGVVMVSTGVIMTRVAAGSEVAGISYSVATLGVNKGKYTFASGDANGNVLISYAYANASNGLTLAMANQNQGSTGSFQAVHVFPWGTEQDMIVFNNCLASSASLSAKKSGFGSTSLDYMASVDTTDSLGTMTFAEAA